METAKHKAQPLWLSFFPIVWILLVLCVSSLCLADDSVKRSAIVGANLLDVDTGKLIHDSLVVIQGSRITYAGPLQDDRVPSQGKLVNGRGKTIIPGLVDLHTHIRSPYLARFFLAAGVTTVRELGSPVRPLLGLVSKVDAGLLPAPRVVPWIAVSASGQPPFSHVISEKSQFSSFFNFVEKEKFQGLKIFDFPSHLFPLLVSESQKRGLMAAVHVDRMSPAEAIRAGSNTIEHIVFLICDLLPACGKHSRMTAQLMQGWKDLEINSVEVQQLIVELKKHKIALVPTLSAMEGILYPNKIEILQPDIKYLGPGIKKSFLKGIYRSDFVADWQDEDWEIARMAFKKMLKFVGELHRSGVVILAGSDNFIPGFGIHRELQLLVDGGLRPVEALEAVTLGAARLLGEESSRGSLQEGKFADLVIINGDPLQDITRTRDIVYIVKEGKFFHPEVLIGK